MRLFKVLKGQLISFNRFTCDDGSIIKVVPLNILDLTWIKEYPIECYICLLGVFAVGVVSVENIDGR